MGAIFHRLRTLVWTALYRLVARGFFTQVGPQCWFEGWIDLPQRGGSILIGQGVRIGRGVEFTVAPGAVLELADGVFIGRGTVISVHRRVHLGANTLVGEYVSIHDNDHITHDADRPVSAQGFEAQPLEIGADCWIGARCVLVRGAGLGRRCVLGAGAVLTRPLPEHTTAAGVPARPLEKTGIAERPRHLSLPSAGYQRRERCPLCLCTEADIAVDFPAIPVLKCSRCGLLYSGRIWPEARTRRYYEEQFDSERHLRGQRLNAEMNDLALGRIVGSLAGKSVLDLGCGYGFFLDRVRRRTGSDVAGVEVAQQPSAYARDVLHLPEIHAALDHLPPERTFDLITCFEVIEHIRDPLPFLREAFRRLAPGGALVVMTDNFASRPVRLMGPAFPKWIPHAHVCHFTPATLGACLTLAGAGRIQFHSLTPWEMKLLTLRARLRPPIPPEQAFHLEDTLATEMRRPFRAFALRRWLGRWWTPLALRPDIAGSLVYAVASAGVPCRTRAAQSLRTLAAAQA
jgi:SAM-dependent methyltransferase/carbonic anhydrase/acetyltransferase-like protein (isoleucine patch superfamily)